MAATDGSEATLSGRHILLASGSRPRSLPGVTIDNDRVLDNAHQTIAEQSVLDSGHGVSQLIRGRFADALTAPDTPSRQCKPGVRCHPGW